jgi:hypothetical protein
MASESGDLNKQCNQCRTHLIIVYTFNYSVSSCFDMFRWRDESSFAKIEIWTNLLKIYRVLRDNFCILQSVEFIILANLLSAVTTFTLTIIANSHAGRLKLNCQLFWSWMLHITVCRSHPLLYKTTNMLFHKHD